MDTRNEEVVHLRLNVANGMVASTSFYAANSSVAGSMSTGVSKIEATENVVVVVRSSFSDEVCENRRKKT